jgi:hypothetical protein
MENDRETRIRERAYALWEQEGRPQGEDLRHWVTALSELDGEDPTPAAITENTSVLGEPGSPADAPAKAGRAPRRSKLATTQITTGQEDAQSAVKHVEGP